MVEIKCCICKDVIVKYIMDLEDTIIVTKRNSPKHKYVCDDCAKQIAMQLVNR